MPAHMSSAKYQNAQCRDRNCPLHSNYRHVRCCLIPAGVDAGLTLRSRPAQSRTLLIPLLPLPLFATAHQCVLTTTTAASTSAHVYSSPSKPSNYGYNHDFRFGYHQNFKKIFGCCTCAVSSSLCFRNHRSPLIQHCRHSHSLDLTLITCDHTRGKYQREKVKKNFYKKERNVISVVLPGLANFTPLPLANVAVTRPESPADCLAC